MAEWITLIWNFLTVPEFMAFFGVLLGLMMFHHHKMYVVLAGFSALSAFYLNKHGLGGYGAHFGHHEEYHLLYNLALLLPGFGLVAHYFEKSGFDARLSKYITKDSHLLWAVFVLSIGLDNIAAALIGAVLLKARYGQNVPFILQVAVVGSSNDGGTGSFTGDTTTVMLFIAGVSILTLSHAFVAAIPVQLALVWWASKHGVDPLPSKRGEATPVNWSLFLPLLAIPGLAIGNIAFDQPGLGLWVGLLLGMIAGRVKMDWHAFKEALPNTYFLVLLVATAGLLPLEALKPLLSKMESNSVAILLGILSPWFDNIPLTAIAIKIGGFDYGLLAFCVGFAGTAMWFGSSAGVALGLKFPEFYNTKNWTKPFFAIMAIYAFGVVCYLGVFYGVIPQAMVLWYALAGFLGITFAGFLAFVGLTAGYYYVAKALNFYYPGKKVFRTWLVDAKEEWH